MTAEMIVPLRWRNKGFMLNPNMDGYRPGLLSPPRLQPELSAKVTCVTYNGDPTSYALREVKSYSEMMYPEVVDEANIPIDISSVHQETQIKVPSGIIYQEASLAG